MPVTSSEMRRAREKSSEKAGRVVVEAAAVFGGEIVAGEDLLTEDV